MKNEELSYRLAIGIASQLVESGVEIVVASPGFRNSPLVLACRKTKGLRTISAVDERGAGFFALGIARTSKKPVAVLCTSGTAVANYFPAVMEANFSHCPLIVITADRPAELVGTGANQCADQIHFFGSHVRHFASIEPALESSKHHEKYATGQAIALALSPRPGPVHINVRFREPFLPDSESALHIETEESIPKFWKFFRLCLGALKGAI